MHETHTLTIGQLHDFLDRVGTLFNDSYERRDLRTYFQCNPTQLSLQLAKDYGDGFVYC